MNKGVIIGLGVLGALALLGSSSKAAMLPSPPPPPPPPPIKPKPKTPGVQVTIGPGTIDQEVAIPDGWIAAMPGEIPSDTVAQMKALNNPPGTHYPFQVNGKNYLGLVMRDGSVAILVEG